jgi:parallel beta-helix repeat protein
MYGVVLFFSNWNALYENNIANNMERGVFLINSSSNALCENNITNSMFAGVCIYDASNYDIVSGNNIERNQLSGISIGGGFALVAAGSNYNIVSGNNITNNMCGMELYSSSNNAISGNNITNSYNGICLSGSSDNRFFHNNFNNNTQHVSSDYYSINGWDDGYPSGGNYWSDYLTRYPNATEIDRTGIGNTPYAIDSNNTDDYPLMKPYPWTAHEIGIISVTASKTIVGQGYNVSFSVTVFNYGNSTKTFNVTAYANTSEIGTKETTLTARNFTSATFTWDTTGLAKGNYAIWAYASPALGEIDKADNIFTYGTVKVTIPGDVDGDFQVTILDVVKITSIYGTKLGNPKFNPNCDIIGDGQITILDVVICTSHYGQKWT